MRKTLLTAVVTLAAVLGGSAQASPKRSPPTIG